MSRFHNVGLVALLGFTVTSCQDEPTLAPGSRAPTTPVSSAVQSSGARLQDLRGNAAEQIARALEGRTLRRGQDDMLRLEAVVPGFGGYYVEGDDQVVVMLKRSAMGSADRVRALLHAEYSQRPSAIERAVMASAANAVVREAAFSLSELVAWESTVLERFDLPGITGTGVNIVKNQVTVTVEQESDGPRVVTALVQAGVPREAINLDVSGVRRLTGTWTDYRRPTRGGIQIALYNSALGFGTQLFFQSHGFNVRLDDQPGQPTVFLTAAHGPNGYFGVNGKTAAAVYQPDVYGGQIGVISTNPPWQTGSSCLYNGVQYDYCTLYDAAIGTFTGSVTGERKIGTSVTEGYNGDVGTQEINNWYPVVGVLAPDQVTTVPSGVHKSGWRTGTTTGTMTEPVYHAKFDSLSWGVLGGPPYKKVLFWSFSRISHIGVGGGDSGGPVFIHNTACGTYCAVGLVSSMEGAKWDSTNTTDKTKWGICKAGTGCNVIVTDFAGMTAGLGQGALNPKTVP